MTLPPAVNFALMLGENAWQRAAFDANTALVDGVVQLAWDALHEGTGGAVAPAPVADPAGAGLAFDTQCRLFHSVPHARTQTDPLPGVRYFRDSPLLDITRSV